MIFIGSDNMNQQNNSGCLSGLVAIASFLGGIASLIYAIMIWFD